MIRRVFDIKLEYGGPFTFNGRAVQRPRNEPFWPAALCKYVPGYHDNFVLGYQYARAMFYNVLYCKITPFHAVLLALRSAFFPMHFFTCIGHKLTCYHGNGKDERNTQFENMRCGFRSISLDEWMMNYTPRTKLLSTGRVC